jgi:hypothetical protein
MAKEDSKPRSDYIPKTEEQKRAQEELLLKSIAKEMPQLEKILEECSGKWGFEDPIYRFYHQSFKLYALQERTQRIVAQLQGLAPQLRMNDWFLEIVSQGTGKVFCDQHNENWTAVTRPMLEAFFHARYFLEMACKYGKILSSAPDTIPSGWAAFLYLFDLR